jgi:hypothetical protein
MPVCLRLSRAPPPIRDRPLVTGRPPGRHKGRTRPAPGNHDYGTAKASGYFGYFGEAAGDPGTGYYAWELISVDGKTFTDAGSAACSPASVADVTSAKALTGTRGLPTNFTLR